MPFGCWTLVKEGFVVCATWVAVAALFICGIGHDKVWWAFAVTILILYSHNSLRGDEALTIAKHVVEIEKKLDSALAEIAKLKGGK